MPVLRLQPQERESLKAYFWSVEEIVAQVKNYPMLADLSEFHIVRDDAQAEPGLLH